MNAQPPDPPPTNDPPDEGAGPPDSAVAQTRRKFLKALAKASAFVPPTLMTLKGRPLQAQAASAYQAWANYFQALANFYAAQGAFAAANYYQFWANYLQALANQAAAQQGMLSPNSMPQLDPSLTGSGENEGRVEPWHDRGAPAPPPWAAPPPAGGPQGPGG